MSMHGRNAGVEVGGSVIPVNPRPAGIAPVRFRHGDRYRDTHPAETVRADENVIIFSLSWHDVVKDHISVIVSSGTVKRDLEDFVLRAAIFFHETSCWPKMEDVEFDEAERSEFPPPLHAVEDGVKNNAHLVI